MKTSLIVVDYKSMELTIAYLEHCSQMIRDWEDVSIVLVDNDPEEKGKNVFLKACESARRETACKEALWRGALFGRPVCYVRANANLGYAKGNNKGAEIADAYFSPDYLLFSNNDIRFPEEISLETLQRPLIEHEQAAAAGPAIMSLQGERQNPGRFLQAKAVLIDSYWNMMLPKVWQSTKCAPFAELAKAGVCDWVSGSFFMADRRKFLEAEGFDTATFLFMEEPILSRRLEKCGYRVYYTDQVKILHAHGQTLKATNSVLSSLRRRFQSEIHFYTEYEHAPKRLINSAVCSFEIFYVLFGFKKKMVNLVRKVAKRG